MGSLLDLAPLSILAPRSWRATSCGISGGPLAPHRRGNDQRTIFHNKSDRTDFFTRIGQEALQQYSRSAQSNNDPTRVHAASVLTAGLCDVLFGNERLNRFNNSF